MDKTQMEEQDVKPSDPGMDAAQRAAKEKELASLRRQRGFKRAAVTRICKSVEDEIARQANRDSIQEVHARLKEAFCDLRKAHQLYESCVGDEEVNEAQTYADRLEAATDSNWKCGKCVQLISPATSNANARCNHS